MAKKSEIYVRLEDGVPALLEAIDSKCEKGKYKVLKYGELESSYYPEIKQRITKTEYDEYKPTKQPAKRSKKNV